MSRGRYLTAARLAELAAGLTARDRAVLATLETVRLATGQQLARLHCLDFRTASSARQCRRCLASLTDRQLVERLPRQIGGVRAGSSGHVYALGPAGVRLAHPDRRARRAHSPGPPTLLHTLEVGEQFIRLREAESAGLLELVEFTAESDCWRPFGGFGGQRWLKPDAFVITAHGLWESVTFVEVDRDTESSTVLDRKLDTYRAYWASGVEQERSGVMPKVVWGVPDERRREQVLAACGRQPADSWLLHQVVLLDDLVLSLVPEP